MLIKILVLPAGALLPYFFLSHSFLHLLQDQASLPTALEGRTVSTSCPSVLEWELQARKKVTRCPLQDRENSEFIEWMPKQHTFFSKTITCLKNFLFSWRNFQWRGMQEAMFFSVPSIHVGGCYRQETRVKGVTCWITLTFSNYSEIYLQEAAFKEQALIRQLVLISLTVPVGDNNFCLLLQDTYTMGMVKTKSFTELLELLSISFPSYTEMGSSGRKE